MLAGSFRGACHDWGDCIEFRSTHIEFRNGRTYVNGELCVSGTSSAIIHALVEARQIRPEQETKLILGINRKLKKHYNTIHQLNHKQNERKSTI